MVIQRAKRAQKIGGLTYVRRVLGEHSPHSYKRFGDLQVHWCFGPPHQASASSLNNL